MLFRLAWKNIWRNKNRTLITMSAIFFAVILSVISSSLKTGIFDNLVKNVVSFHSGYIQIHKRGYWDEQILENAFATNTRFRRKILSEKDVTVLAPRLESFSLAASATATKGCMVIGIYPELENQVTLLKSRVKGNYLNDNDNQVLLAQGLAERLRLRINDTILLISQGFHGATAAGKYRIKGLVKFGSPELNNKVLIMPLVLAQEFYSAKEMITAYVLGVKNPSQIENITSNLNRTLGKEFEVMTWKEMMPGIQQHIETDSRNIKVIQVMLYIIIGFGILGGLLMLMVERRFEMGMLVAIGMKKSKLASLILIESILTVISGCFLGIMASIPIVYYLSKHPIRIGGETSKAYERFGFESVFPTAVKSEIFIYQGLIVLVIGLVLSIYPLYKIILFNPVNAMRR